MGPEREINIHDIINVELDERLPGRQAWLDALGDVITISSEHLTPPRVLLKVNYRERFSSKGLQRLAQHIYIENHGLLDLRFRVRLASPAKNVLLLEASYPCPEWLVWSLQLALLGTGATFIHCAAIEKAGKAVIFPSWAGVGKTALAARFVMDKGWNFLGDDKVVLTADGSCYGFPTPMALHHAHKSVVPELSLARRGPTAPIGYNSFLINLAAPIKLLLRRWPRLLQFARQHNPMTYRVKPSEIFGSKKLARKAELDKTVWLQPVKGLSRARLFPADGNLCCRIMGSMLYEFDPWCVRLTGVAMGLGIVSCEQSYAAWLDTLKRGLDDRAQFILELPADLPLHDLPKVVEDILIEQALWSL